MLKVNANYTKINAESQMNDPESVRSFYKKLIALRKNPEYKEDCCLRRTGTCMGRRTQSDGILS